ncbi:MAG: hypothetical protein NW241_20150 [Bacteroidia bacterium]|nr:hypothetical protein [Bacteroidia bacterium]
MRIVTVEIDQDQDFVLLGSLLERLGLKWRSAVTPERVQDLASHLEIVARGVSAHASTLQERIEALDAERADRDLPFFRS